MCSERIVALVFALCFAACGGRTGSDPTDTVGSGGTGGSGSTGSGGTGGSGGGTSVQDASTDVRAACDEQSRAARDLINDVVTQVQKDRSCVLDTECTNVSVSALCSASCTTFTNVVGAKKIRTAIAEIETTACAGFKEKGCFSPEPPCVPPLMPVCLNGSCTPFR